MFRLLAQFVSSRWLPILLVWSALFGICRWTSPDWEQIVSHGEFSFLPRDAPSRAARRKLEQAFPDADYGSSLLFLLEREGGKLTEEDLALFQEQLLPAARKVAGGNSGDQPSEASSAESPVSSSIVGNLGPTAPVVGEFLKSEDRRAALGLLQLSREFFHEGTWRFVTELQNELEALQQRETWPDGLNLYLSGSAVLGRDIIQYRWESAQWIRSYAIWFVVGLLLLVFRAPLLVLVPLVTLSVAIEVAMALLALMANWGWLVLFDGVEVYLTVIAYGAGVDYSMFLISRYREELTLHTSDSKAMRISVGQTGNAIAASACTEILGIGMLIFAAFGKLSQAGYAISIAMAVMLAASLTLTPALLRLGGRRAFWPAVPDPSERTDEESRAERLWRSLADRVIGHPRTVMVSSLVVLAIPAAFGIWKYNQLSYGLIAELPRESMTRRAVGVLEEHFGQGIQGPVTALLVNRDRDFESLDAEEFLRRWSERVAEDEGLRIANVQSFPYPLGLRESVPDITWSPFARQFADEVTSFQSAQHYVAQTGELQHHATRARLFLDVDPFSRDAIYLLERLHQELSEALPAEWREGTEVYLTGPTASLRALQQVVTRDQQVLFPRVAAVVFVTLVVLLRKGWISLYLIASIGVTFLVTMGVTWLVFRLWVGADFAGLDWSVPLLLFTLLMAVGADYNVLLVARTDEEMEQAGAKRGVTEAMATTGPIITACGVVMSGTFATLLFGSQLMSMQQLGFALAFGVLLDTFVVRPFLVPCFIVLRANAAESSDQDQ